MLVHTTDAVSRTPDLLVLHLMPYSISNVHLRKVKKVKKKKKKKTLYV